jgi:hypothetical protein
MRHLKYTLQALTLCGLLSCASSPEDVAALSTPTFTPPSPTSAPQIEPIEREVDLGEEIAPAPDVLRVARVAVEVEEAEDGYGNIVTATNPIAVDIVATRWIGRALDPVLEVDGRQFRKYVHPGPGLIRFVLADAAWLDEAQSFAIQYGDDLKSRVPLSIDPPSRP